MRSDEGRNETRGGPACCSSLSLSLSLLHGSLDWWNSTLLSCNHSLLSCSLIGFFPFFLFVLCLIPSFCFHSFFFLLLTLHFLVFFLFVSLFSCPYFILSGFFLTVFLSFFSVPFFIFLSSPVPSFLFSFLYFLLFYGYIFVSFLFVFSLLFFLASLSFLPSILPAAFFLSSFIHCSFLNVSLFPSFLFLSLLLSSFSKHYHPFSQITCKWRKWPAHSVTDHRWLSVFLQIRPF